MSRFLRTTTGAAFVGTGLGAFIVLAIEWPLMGFYS